MVLKLGHRLSVYIAICGVWGLISGVVLGEQSSQSTMTDLVWSTPALGKEDRHRYGMIFDLQDMGDLKAADKHIQQVSDPVLMGYVLYQRYMHPTAYRSSYKDLHLWMIDYATYPGAHAIYKLAQKRRISGWKPTPEPNVSLYMGGKLEIVHATPSAPKMRTAKARSIYSQVVSLIRRGGPTAAERTLRQESSIEALGRVGFDYLAWRISRSHFVNNNTKQALELASLAAIHSSEYVPLADWIAGLAAWQLNKYDSAMKHFERLARSKTAPDWARAGAAFWYMRGAEKYGNISDGWTFVKLGASQATSFYSILCQELLGITLMEQRHAVDLTDRPAMKRLWQNPRIRRARAASEVGRDDIASNELRAAYAESASGDRAALLALVPYLNVPAFSFQIGQSVDSIGMVGRWQMQYPLPSWTPENGFSIDRALLYALIRQESQFKPRAKSRAGARGLMQLMPRTASFIAHDNSLRSYNSYKLFNPEFNITLGQKYVEHLMETADISRDLLSFAAAYNGGPGNLQKWHRKKLLNTDDPLLFVETIPHKETRNYVKAVLSNFWMYRMRLGQNVPSLNALADGRWPTYFALDPATPFKQIAIAK